MEKGKNLVKKSASISAIVLIGKVLGFIKQAVIAWAFGANSLTDVYFAADGFTSMFGQILSQSVGPTVLTQYVKLSEEGRVKESKKLIRNCYLFFFLLSIFLIAVCLLFSKQICDIIGLSYSPEQKVELRFFLMLLCPVMLLTAMIGVSSGYLDSNNRFLPGRLTSLFFSCSIIIFVILFKNKLGLKSLLFGFLLGYILHTILMLSLVIPKVGVGINNPFKNPDFMAMIKRFIPLVIGVSVVDLGHLVDKIVASSLAEGSVSALHYGQVISSDVVNAVLITSVGTVLLTAISKSVAANTERADLMEQIRKILSAMTFIAGGLSVLYCVEGYDLVKLFFERGGFDSTNTKVVTSVAVCYSAGFVFMANREVLIKTHYAFHDTLSPMINSIVGVCINIVGSICFSKILGISGVALATSVSLFSVFLISLFTLRKHIRESIIDRKLFFDYIKMIITIIISGGIGKLLVWFLPDFFYLLRMVIISAIVLIIYIFVGLLIRVKTVDILWNKVKRVKR